MKEIFDYCESIASSSTANLGPGFDVFGLGLDLFYDRISIRKLETEYGKIRVVLDKDSSNIPISIEENSASLPIMKLAEKYEIKNDLEIRINKGVPVGFGLGSSAASCAAAVVAFNELFECELSKNELIEFAAEGELSSAGTKHYDNVAASLFGGFIIVRTFPTLEHIKIDTPKDLVLVVCIPNLVTHIKKTKVARSVIPKQIPIENLTKNLANACLMVSGFFLRDINLITKGINDTIIEPARKHLIDGYDKVRSNALYAGALAVTISGAGPSMIALTNSTKRGYKIGEAMKQGFIHSKIQSSFHICLPSNGAKVILKS